MPPVQFGDGALESTGGEFTIKRIHPAVFFGDGCYHERDILRHVDCRPLHGFCFEVPLASGSLGGDELADLAVGLIRVIRGRKTRLGRSHLVRKLLFTGMKLCSCCEPSSESLLS